MMQIVYRNPTGTTYDFTAATRQVQGLDGDGIPELEPQSQAYPTRDGEIYIGGFFGPRYLRVRWVMDEPSRAAILAARMAAITALNPRDGLGVLYVTPVAGGATYAIDGVLTALDGLDNHIGPGTVEAIAAFRCPQPAWREEAENTIVLGASGGGLSFPLTFPMTFAESGDTQNAPNAGHLPVYPVITATGGFEGLQVRNETTGLLVHLPSLVVVPGQELVIDLDRRTITLDGVNVMPYRSAASSSWPLEKGSNTIAVSVAAGSVNVVMTYPTLLLGI